MSTFLQPNHSQAAECDSLLKGRRRLDCIIARIPAERRHAWVFTFVAEPAEQTPVFWSTYLILLVPHSCVI